MSIIATAVRHLMAAGVSGEDLVRAIADMEAAQPKDAAAEKRRAWDRQRKAEQRERARLSTGLPPESADNADTPPVLDKETPPTPPKEINPTPHANPACARGDFPKPDWADAQVWRDLLANRRKKKLSNTPTAHKRLLDDIAKHSDAQWPPGRLLEACVAKGWGAIYESVKDDDDGRRTNERMGGNRGGNSSSGMGRTVDAAQRFLARRAVGGDHGPYPGN